MAKGSMVGEDSIAAAERCIAEQQKGDMDHARAHGKERHGRDGDSDMAKVKKLGGKGY